MAGKADTLLKDYRAKRDFAKTQEPQGDGPTREASQRAFVVQKHDATRLHFDFRIELDGVLKSWAVTKGPSDNPADKRLAVRVEDHPLDYGSFEGTIPEGEYGGGTVMLWDQGTWEPIGDPHEGLKSGDLKLRLSGQRMKGEWVLVHMKGRDSKRKSGPDRENWLLIKHRDKYARDEESLVPRFTTSVSTGRDFAGIAKGLKPKKKTATPAKSVWHSDPDREDENPDLPAIGAKPRNRKPAKATKGTHELPVYRPPQLATLVDAVPEGRDWLFEMKYDGYRCLAAVSGAEVALYTRNGKDWTDRFGALVEPLSQLTAGSALIDGEICAFDAKGRTDFSTLKAALSDGGRLEFFAFDLLEQDGKDLTSQPLTERKVALKTLLGQIGKGAPIQYSDHVTGNGQKVLDAICREGHEGVIAKRIDAPYRSERNRSWLKIKCARRQEFVIAGWSPSAKKKTFASLLLGTWEDGKLIYRGRVGTGFTMDDAADLQQKLDQRARKTSPFDAVPRPIARGARWVTPDLVGEIGYTEFTPDGILRHPSFLALREDKAAKDIALEEPAGSAPSPARKPAKAKAKSAPVDLSDAAGIAVAERVGVRLTSPDRLAFPQQGVTKAEIVAYYDAVAARMLPMIADRPLSLLRCPQGRTKYCFFQKHDTGGFPGQMKSVEVVEKDGEKEDYFYIEDLAGLVAGTQMNVLEWHIWGSRRTAIEKPERLIFDIDPDEGLGFEAVKSAARDIRAALAEIGLESVPLVSGGKGVHVIVPIRPNLEWPDIKAFSKGVAQTLATAEPDRFTANMSKARRKGRLFIDYLRNERGSTAIAPWSIRSRVGAPVAVPVTWDELDRVKDANQFSLPEAAERAASADPWPDYGKSRQTVTKAMLAGLGVE
jgi:bifunctional non-homologous end joining protein LigD